MIEETAQLYGGVLDGAIIETEAIMPSIKAGTPFRVGYVKERASYSTKKGEADLTARVCEQHEHPHASAMYVAKKGKLKHVGCT